MQYREYRPSRFSISILDSSSSLWYSGTSYENIIYDEETGDEMLIGYARVSTHDQNLSLQKQELKKIGCEKIYDDTMSGRQSDRPGLAMVLEILREGDTLAVWKLDRLGRSLKQLISLVEELEQRGVHFRSLTDNIDTQTTAGRFFFHVMASLAEMERELIVERTRAGLKAAKVMGRTGGRKRLMSESKIESAKKLLASGVPAREVAANLGISVPTLYRWVPASQ
jgi:DNA invertase Pin-like site-specific DNA recombinase